MPKLRRLSRTLHRQASLIAALPLLIIVVTGILLMLRGEFDWIQPQAQTGQAPHQNPTLQWEAV